MDVDGCAETEGDSDGALVGQMEILNNSNKRCSCKPSARHPGFEVIMVTLHSYLGLIDGEWLGAEDGCTLGTTEGTAEGDALGPAEGLLLGSLEGETEGCSLGLTEG